MEQIEAKINELREMKGDAKEQKRNLDDQAQPIDEKVRTLEKKIEEVETRQRARCIAGRNEYSKGAIQQDFATGIRELDQEIAEEEDAANFNPEEDARDYDKVASSLPVFCVSSRGYQKLKGRLKKESNISGFQNLEETQIPQLQEHCKALTVKGRTNACTQFLAVLSQLLNSLLLWGQNDGTGANLTKDQRTRQEKQLQQSLKQLYVSSVLLVHKC